MKEYFSAFLTYQMFRTMEFQKRLKHIREQAKELFKNDPQSLERFGLNVDSSAQNDQIQLLFSDETSKQMVALQSWTWLVMDNQTSFNFISSDNPVVRLSLDESPEAVGIRIHLPLTPKKALMVMNQEAVKSLKINFEPQIIRIPKDWVRTYNELQIMHSHRQLYGVSDNFKIAEKVLFKWPGLKNVDDPKYLVQLVNSPAIDSST